MSLPQLAIRIGAVLIMLAALVVAVSLWPRGDSQSTTKAGVWTCSMHPQIRLPAPGQCPICGMKLIPVSQLPRARDDLEQRSGLETELVQRRELVKEIRTVGKLDYSERQVAFIAARIAGRVDRVFADFTGLDVKQGDHLVAIYSPELNVAQTELLLALDARDKEKEASPAVQRFAGARLESVRTKLRLLGILDEQIAEIEESRKTTTHLTIHSPIGGTVIEKAVRVGQYVTAGDQLYRIADLDPIWLYLNIYEADIAWVRFGQTVDVALEAFADESFRGTVTFIDPFLDDATRSLRVRVNLKNPDRRLKPQMYATATIRVPLLADGSSQPTGVEGKYVCPMHPEVIQDQPGKCSICEMPLVQVPNRPATSRKSGSDTALAIPVSAVLDTGRRRIAYRVTKDGEYELVELKLGPRARSADDAAGRHDFFVVLEGLNDGDRVVVQSGFLLDSQRQIEGLPSLLFPAGQATGTSGHAGHGGHAETKAAPVAPSQRPSGHKH